MKNATAAIAHKHKHQHLCLVHYVTDRMARVFKKK